MRTTEKNPVPVFSNVCIDANVPIVVYLPHDGEDESAALGLGSNEALVIHSTDVQGLENLRDAAGEAARRLRARIRANAQAREASSASQPDDEDRARLIEVSR